MTKEEKCIEAIERGFTYDPITGIVFGVRGLPVKNTNGMGYFELTFQKDSKRYYIKAHIFAWYWVHKECVDIIDHINTIRNDNRIENLRSVTFTQNVQNSSKAKGYYWHKNNKRWCSNIWVNGIIKRLGYFLTEEEAKQAYLEAKSLYHYN